MRNSIPSADPAEGGSLTTSVNTTSIPWRRLVKPTLAAVVTEQLRSMVLTGRIAPGAQMNEGELATRFGTSRGPIREAVQRLVEEGLLVSEAHRGVWVRQLSRAEVEDLYFARAVLERAACLRVLQRGPSASLLANLQQALGDLAYALETEDWSSAAASDLRFHTHIVEAAASPLLSRMFDTLAGLTRLGLNLSVGYRRRQEVVDEHTSLLQSLADGDRAALLAALDDHFNVALENLTAVSD
jgi:DNA-binding GntR family transcriptional regulator